MLVRCEHIEHKIFQLRIYRNIFDNNFQCMHNFMLKHYVFCLVNKPTVNIQSYVYKRGRNEQCFLVTIADNCLKKKLCLQKAC